MKNKLHTTSCHPELVIPTEVEGSHKITKLLLLLLFPLCGLTSYAQPYQWDWAINGGGSLGESGWYYQVEQIFDIQVGTDDNYYFVAK